MINRREAIKVTALAAAATAVAPSLLAQTNSAAPVSAPAPFTLPPLPYAVDALEPHIDARTMEIHHDRHHKAYVDNLNKLYSGAFASYLPKGTIDQINDNLHRTYQKLYGSSDSGDTYASLCNNAGGHFNHSLFWQSMIKSGGGEPKGELAHAIDSSFGSFREFKEKFTRTALGVFGSGWAWLYINEDISVAKSEKVLLKISANTNQDNPLIRRMTDYGPFGGVPLLGLDVWEHAYYLKYQNKRADYIAAWWNVVNWDFVTERYLKAKH